MMGVPIRLSLTLNGSRFGSPAACKCFVSRIVNRGKGLKGFAALAMFLKPRTLTNAFKLGQYPFEVLHRDSNRQVRTRE